MLTQIDIPNGFTSAIINVLVERRSKNPASNKYVHHILYKTHTQKTSSVYIGEKYQTKHKN